MTAATTSTLSLVNQAAIVEALRAHGALSRPELVERTGLSPATVSRLTAVLIADGLVVDDGVAPSTGGRPSIVLRYNGASRLVAAVRVEQGSFTGALVDFDGVVVERMAVETSFAGSGSEADDGPAPVLRALVHRLIHRAAERGSPCRAVGISVPFAVTPDGRMVGTDDDPAWSTLTSADITPPAVTIPVLIENGANALAIGELHNGVGRHSPHFAVMLLTTGLGAGIVTNGALYRGSRSAAGEIGYLLLGGLSEGRPDRRGDLEARLGGAALRAEAIDRGLALGEDAPFSSAEVFALAQSGNVIGRVMAEPILDAIAGAVAAISSVLDPEFVVLGEGLSEHAAIIIPALERRLTGRIFRVPQLGIPALAGDAVLLGAAEMAMRSVTQRAHFTR